MSRTGEVGADPSWKEGHGHVEERNNIWREGIDVGTGPAGADQVEASFALVVIHRARTR